MIRNGMMKFVLAFAASISLFGMAWAAEATASRPNAEVFLPQQPGDTSSMTDSGTANPARLTPNPCAPGELNARVAGEL